MNEEKITNEQNNEELFEKEKWETPELFILETDDTLFTANPGNDGTIIS